MRKTALRRRRASTEASSNRRNRGRSYWRREWRRFRGLASIAFGCDSGDRQLVRELIERGADVNLPRGKKYTTLIQYAPDAYRPYGSAPLHLAVVKKDVAMAQLLLSCGAAANQKDNRGLTPLHLCALCDFVDAAKLLLNSGADVNAESAAGTPLRLACDRSMRLMTDLLVARGAAHDVFTAAASDNVEALRELLGSSPETFSDRRDGWTPLHCAAERGSLRAAGYLISSGAEVDVIEGDEETSDDYDGYTPLFLSVARGDAKLAALLLRHGANPNAISKSGDSLLYLAVLWDQVELIHVLLDGGATDIDGAAANLARTPNPTCPNRTRILHVLQSECLSDDSNLPQDVLSLEGYQALRRMHVQEGGDGDALDRLILASFAGEPISDEMVGQAIQKIAGATGICPMCGRVTHGESACKQCGLAIPDYYRQLPQEKIQLLARLIPDYNEIIGRFGDNEHTRSYLRQEEQFQRDNSQVA